MRIKILYNKKKKWASVVAREAAFYLGKCGFKIVLKKADLTIAIGGDGTILYYNFIGELEGSIIGIGSDSSHICQLRRNNWKDEIVSIIKRKKIQRRRMLRSIVDEKNYNVINDVVIHTPDYRVICVDVLINNNRYSFEGDGIIVSTPTGSSGYAHSAGGKIIKPKSKRIIIVPICAYKRAFKMLIINDNAIVKVKSKDNAAIIIDGVFIKNIKNKQITIRRGKEWYYLVRK